MWAAPTAFRAPTDTEIRAAMTRETLGGKLYPKTAAETTATVTPTDYGYPSGHAFRFGLLQAASDSARRLAIQAAFDSSGPALIPAGEWTIDEALRWNSNNHLRGNGMDITIVKLGETAHEDANVIEPAAYDSSIVNWSIKDITFDGNFDRATVIGFGAQRPGSSCIATMGASYGYIHDVKVKDAVQHGLDICCGGEVSGDRAYVLAVNEAAGYYPNNESQYIDINNIWAENCGDDAITGHYSKNISVGVVRGFSTGGRNTFGYSFEIDDGCRNWTVDRVIADGGNRGFACKNHAPQPAPSGIVVNSIVTTGCHMGAYIDGDGGALEDSGKRISIGRIVVRDPADNGNAPEAEWTALYINSASDIDIGSVLCIANGDESFLLENAVKIANNSNRVNIGRITARNWPYNNTADSSIAAVHVSGTCADVSIGKTILNDCGWQGVKVSGSPSRINVGAVNAVLTAPLTGSIAVLIDGNPPGTKPTVMSISQSGYDLGSSYVFGTPDTNSVDGQPVNDGRIEILNASETKTGTATASLDRNQTDMDSSGGAVTLTLPDGMQDGQRKKITMSDATNGATVTVTSHETSSPEVGTFAQTTDVWILEWDAANAYWWTVKNIGVAL